MKLLAFIDTDASSVSRDGNFASKLMGADSTSIVGNRKMFPDELIEIRIEKINSDYLDGLGKSAIFICLQKVLSKSSYFEKNIKLNCIFFLTK